MLRPLVYGLLIYFALLAMMAYGNVDRFFFWIGVCSVATFFGALMGSMFGAIHLREAQDDRY